MLHPPGTVLLNPITAEWGRVLSADPDRHVAELLTAPGGGVRVMHRHPRQEEQFDVLAGELTVVLDGETHVTASPTLDFQEMISAMGGLCALRRARPDGGSRPA